MNRISKYIIHFCDASLLVGAINLSVWISDCRRGFRGLTVHYWRSYGSLLQEIEEIRLYTIHEYKTSVPFCDIGEFASSSVSVKTLNFPLNYCVEQTLNLSSFDCAYTYMYVCNINGNFLLSLADSTFRSGRFHQWKSLLYNWIFTSLSFFLLVARNSMW